MFLQASADSSWKEPAREIMGAYTERTDGSFLEEKESALVWHYKNADPGGFQIRIG